MRYNLYLIILTFMLQGCNNTYGPKGYPCPAIYQDPSLRIYISDAANDDLFSQQYLGSFPRDSVKLYHLNSSGKINYDSVGVHPATDTSHSVYIIYSKEASDQSLSGVHTFYFKRGFQVIDTILFDESMTEPCDMIVLNSLKYNGVDIKNNHTIVVQ